MKAFVIAMVITHLLSAGSWAAKKDVPCFLISLAIAIWGLWVIL